MAWLCIDTHIPRQSRLGVLVASGWRAEEEVLGRANVVLARLAALHTMYIGEITGVIVVEGPGSFSAIRTGVLYANLYARLRSLPLLAIRPAAWANPLELWQACESGVLTPQEYVAPVYDQEPNITIPTPTP